MGRFFRCPLPLHSVDSDQFQSSDSSLNSSSNSSISSQQSLPSVPSLTPPAEHTVPAADHHCLTTFRCNSSYIFSLALAGNHLYCGASNGEIRVWDRNSSSYSSDNHIVADGRSAVKSIVVLGEKLFTAHNDHKIRVWRINETSDGQNYKQIKVLPTISDRCMRLLSAKNYVQIRRNKRSTWVHHVDAVSELALTKDGSLLYSISWDRTFKIWRTSDFKCLESVQNAHDDAINAVVLSDDGLVYTGSADKLIKVWKKKDNEQTHTLISTLEKHRSAVNALALSTDGSILYSGACDRSIVVWEKEGGGSAAHMAVVGALRGHTKAILCLAVVADLLCSGSADRTVRIWRRGRDKSFSCLAVFEGHKSPVKCLTAVMDSCDDVDAKNGNDSDKSFLIYSGSLDSEVMVWKIRVPFSN